MYSLRIDVFQFCVYTVFLLNSCQCLLLYDSAFSCQGYIASVVEYECGPLVEWNRQGITKVRVRVLAPVLLCPPQIPHELAWDRTIASFVRGQRLTA